MKYYKSKLTRTSVVFICLVMSVNLLIGCRNENKESKEKSFSQTEIIVSAAASLSESYAEIAKKFKEEKNINVILNFGGSQSLSTSIIEGAKVDVFASANMTYMNNLREKGIISDEFIFAKNHLVVCKNKKSKAEIKKISDLGNKKVRLIVGDKTVPVGSYFYNALDDVLKENKISIEEKNNIIKNIRSNELNVKDVVSKVLLGEGDVGVVYKTDINNYNSGELDIIEIEELNKIQAIYPIGVVNTSTKKDAAEEFIDYIRNGNGREILRKHGFLVD